MIPELSGAKAGRRSIHASLVALRIARMLIGERPDARIARAVAAFALVVYAVALAPDVLYADSGELQTLAYTWGSTHPTGYPIYVLLARVVGSLPLHTPAWRISLFSAACGALCVAQVYLVARYFARRGAALLASGTLLVASTLWSLSIIAEVYTAASAVLLLIVLLLLRWREAPIERRRLLFISAMLLCAGMGVHMFTMVVMAPAVALFVGWNVRAMSTRRAPSIAAFAAGLAVGSLLFVGAFALVDSRTGPVNYFESVMIPSRAAWGLTSEDFDTFAERFAISVTGVQWQDRMGASDLDVGGEVQRFLQERLRREFSLPTLFLALLGIAVMLLRRPRDAAMPLGVLAVDLVVALLYHPPDKFIFYLPAYLMLAVSAAAGADWLVERLGLTLRTVRVQALALAALLACCVAPFVPSRAQAMRDGVSSFAEDRYPYPEDLTEPRRMAECVLSELAPHALLLADWRQMWPIAYLAHVEARRPDVRVWEVFPYGAQGLTASMAASIDEALGRGVPVYTHRDDLLAQLPAGYRLNRGRTCPVWVTMYALEKNP